MTKIILFLLFKNVSLNGINVIKRVWELLIHICPKATAVWNVMNNRLVNSHQFTSFSPSFVLISILRVLYIYSVSTVFASSGWHFRPYFCELNRSSGKWFIHDKSTKVTPSRKGHISYFSVSLLLTFQRKKKTLWSYLHNTFWVIPQSHSCQFQSWGPHTMQIFVQFLS